MTIMKRNDISRAGKILLIIIVSILMSIMFLWRIPIYLRLKNIVIPQNSVDIETKIILSDVYKIHILGERVIKCDMGFEKIISYIEENNRAEKLNNIEITPFFRDWDDTAIFPNDYYDIVSKEEYSNYIVIRYYKAFE